MESNKIRELYLKFFEGKGHRVIPSSSLIPVDDPTLLFTNAGMVQFKKYWATDIPLPFKRATSCQKCLRVGGKDSDLEKIGESKKHHTFFEMLGNFSFGDYFKKEAIDWAFEFVVDVLKIPREKLWVSYYEEDIETRKLWERYIPSERIVPLGKKDNFWGPAGDSGPCGPCSEIYIDFGEEKSCGKPDCKPGCECERFLEFWNLVFPQYDMQPDGKLLPLKRRGVDTGMGLERIARILQNTETNYETDLFYPIIKKIEELSGQKYSPYSENSGFFRIIADHIRAIVFLLDENIVPSNEGRGYVVRRIIRRASLAGKNLGFREPFLYKISESVIKTMKDVYPSVLENKNYIEKILYDEEEKFTYIIDSANKIFEETLKDISKKMIPGDVAFKLYDTYGIPPDVIEDLAMGENIKVDWNGFRKIMEERKAISREKSAFSGNIEKIFESEGIKETEFVGYDNLECESEIAGLYKEKNKNLIRIVTKQTPFYPEKGGQIGDRGIIENEEIKVRVYDTQIDEKGLIHHIGKLEKGNLESIKENMKVKLSVEPEFRKKVSINHTATHLLHYALREILGKEVRQYGSYVGDDKLRFDFICFSSLDDEKIKKIERLVQNKIFENSNVKVEEMSLEEAIKKGAIALFVGKYGENVRVVHTGDYHSEVCGGTHVKSTGEICIFKITNYSSIGRNLRRIEAFTYQNAYLYMEELEEKMKKVCGELGIPQDRLVKSVINLKKEIEEKEKSLRKYKDLVIKDLSERLSSEALKFNINGKETHFVGRKIKVENVEDMGFISDKIVDTLKRAVVLLGMEKDKRIYFIMKVSEDLKEIFNAGKIIKEISQIVDGKGGGNPVFAQGSGKEPSKFNDMIKNIKERLENAEKSRF